MRPTRSYFYVYTYYYFYYARTGIKFIILLPLLLPPFFFFISFHLFLYLYFPPPSRRTHLSFSFTTTTTSSSKPFLHHRTSTTISSSAAVITQHGGGGGGDVNDGDGRRRGPVPLSISTVWGPFPFLRSPLLTVVVVVVVVVTVIIIILCVRLLRGSSGTKHRRPYRDSHARAALLNFVRRSENTPCYTTLTAKRVGNRLIGNDIERVERERFIDNSYLRVYRTRAGLLKMSPAQVFAISVFISSVRYNR